jgi:hypothetical protein
MQKPLSNNMHALNFNDTRNIQHYTHTPVVQQVQKSVNMYQGQTKHGEFGQFLWNIT